MSEFVLRDGDGNPVPTVVRHPFDQIRDIFTAASVRLYQDAFPPVIIGFDDEPVEEDELAMCVGCTREYHPCYVDANNICDDCHDREERWLLSIPPFVRTDENWARLEELGYERTC